MHTKVGKWRSVFLIFVIGLSGCAPLDPNLRKKKSGGVGEGDSQVTGVDYLAYTAYRLAEVKRIVENFAVLGGPMSMEAIAAKTPVAKNHGPCGLVKLVNESGERRAGRVLTQACLLSNANNSELSLEANGEEAVELTTSKDGQLEQLTLSTGRFPYTVFGKVIQGANEGSHFTSWEYRELKLELESAANQARTYHFSYAVEMSWEQRVSDKYVIATENPGRGHLALSGTLSLEGGVVGKVSVDLITLDGNATRGVQRRSRFNDFPLTQKMRTIRLLVAAKASESGSPIDFQFVREGCGLPVGEFKVADYYSSARNDFLGDKVIRFTANGVELDNPANAKPWPGCRPKLAVSVAGDGVELGNFIPYSAIFLR